MGFEPMTACLGSRYSTTELYSLYRKIPVARSLQNLQLPLCVMDMSFPPPTTTYSHPSNSTTLMSMSLRQPLVFNTKEPSVDLVISVFLAAHPTINNANSANFFMIFWSDLLPCPFWVSSFSCRSVESYCLWP